MQLDALPESWMPTRATLQRYAQMMTAFPRAAAPSDPRWGQVSMSPTPTGFAATPTPLGDGAYLMSELDLVNHSINVATATERFAFDIAEGLSPSEVGRTILDLAMAEGLNGVVDRDRFSDTYSQVYDAVEAERFLAASLIAASAMDEVDVHLSGEIAGPHLWPHGFDVAAEWYSSRLVKFEGSTANAQITIGWYPSDQSYIYVNPWPFAPEFAATDLPGNAVWHFDGWQGAKLEVPERGGLPVEAIVELGLAVHAATRSTLS